MVGFWVAARAAELEGTWRLEMAVRSIAELPVARAASTTRTVAVVTLRAEGEVLTWEHRACTVDIEDGNPFSRTELPAALVAALPPTVASLERSGEALRVDLGTSHLGYDPSLAGGELPTSPDDPAVVDAEGDGRPGATVRVSVRGFGSYDLSVVQRSRAVLEGAWVGDEVHGAVHTVDFAQVVLAADHALLRKAPPVRQDDAGSRFVLTRLPDGAGCGEAVGVGGDG